MIKHNDNSTPAIPEITIIIKRLDTIGYSINVNNAILVVIDNKSATEVKYEMGNQVQTTKELSTRARDPLEECKTQKKLQSYALLCLVSSCAVTAFLSKS